MDISRPKAEKRCPLIISLEVIRRLHAAYRIERRAILAFIKKQNAQIRKSERSAN